MKLTIPRRLTGCFLILAFTVMTFGCASKTGGTALGAIGGAIVGGAVGYAVGGEQGAMIGAGAGAVAGGVAGYALSKPKEKQVQTEQQLQQTAAQQGAPILQPVLEVQELAVTPPEIAAGEPVTLDMNLRAVSGTAQQIAPPAVNVTVSRDGNQLREQQLAAQNTGDVQMQSVFEVPKFAEAGTYTVAVQTIPQGAMQPSRKEAQFIVKAGPGAEGQPQQVGSAPSPRARALAPQGN
ncbi:hypothetical protein IT570_04375 [Candidatus Sumerlaeota bacterium]|nr:hypothetical protein [Candidatus Sumerlaeota bacterium]